MPATGVMLDCERAVHCAVTTESSECLRLGLCAVWSEQSGCFTVDAADDDVKTTDDVVAATLTGLATSLSLAAKELAPPSAVRSDGRCGCAIGISSIFDAGIVLHWPCVPLILSLDVSVNARLFRAGRSSPVPVRGRSPC